MSDHIDDDTFEKLALHELSGSDRERALGHIGGCGTCAAIYKVLLGVEDGARKAKLIAPPRRTAWWVGAGVAIAMAAAIVLWLVQRPPLAVTRGSQDTVLQLLRPTGDVRPPIELAWDGTATTYKVDVLTADGHPVWSRTVTGTSVIWPAEVPVAAGEYQWFVSVLDGKTVVSESSIGTFRIQP